MCPFIAQEKQVLLTGQLRVGCSSRTPQVKHYERNLMSLVLSREGGRKYTYDQKSAFVCPMLIFCSAFLAKEPRLLCILYRRIEVTLCASCLYDGECPKMHAHWLYSQLGRHNRDILCTTLIPSLILAGE